MKKACLAFVLHAHLPYVRHPESDNYLEERWLFEAITEAYIPLINLFESLETMKIDYKITLSLTPTLLSMLNDNILREKYIRYLERMICLSEKEKKRTRKNPEFFHLAEMYNKLYEKTYYQYTIKYEKNLIKAFKKLHDTGKVEFLASAATHGYLPLLNLFPQVVNAQITLGVNIYKKIFGEKPEGIWLPECGYTPSIEKSLKKNGINYFITESHGVLFAEPKPVFGTYKPIVTENGIAVFGRDIQSSKQVWSSKEGYPGDFDYREYYRDIGYDLDYNYIKDFISPDGRRTHTGIKYYKITGTSECKKTYEPQTAIKKAKIHADNFIHNKIKQINSLSRYMDESPVIVCPYDAELFGHWWYEGPCWLKNIFTKIKTQEILKPVTLSEYIINNPSMQLSKPCSSSWGRNGYNEFWLNHSNDWIYKHLFKASERMVELANNFNSTRGIIKEALNQAAREVLLAQSSDWAFIMNAGTMVEYAIKRTKEHLTNFSELYFNIKNDKINENWLNSIKYKNNIFPDMDYKIFSN